MHLTELQQQHFDTFGFLIIPAFLDVAMVEALRQSLDRMKTEESGESNPLKHRGRVIGMFHKDELLLRLFDDPRLYAMSQQLLRTETLRFLGDEYASFSTPADWHMDMLQALPAESIKFGFYLDDITFGGYLRVVLGSHHGTFSDSLTSYRASQPSPEIDSAHACMTRPGDLLIFNLKLWHQGTANPNGTYRRVIFWSVGQDHPEWNFMARKFHGNLGRGDADAPWPPLILENPPQHRVELLNVFAPGTAKHRALTDIYRCLR